MKQDRTVWTQLALVELLEERALMGQLGPRHGNIQEAEGGHGFYFYILIESQTLISIYLSGWRGWKQPCKDRPRVG